MEDLGREKFGCGLNNHQDIHMMQYYTVIKKESIRFKTVDLEGISMSAGAWKKTDAVKVYKK